jgi:hypothetical protein
MQAKIPMIETIGFARPRDFSELLMMAALITACANMMLTQRTIFTRQPDLFFLGGGTGVESMDSFVLIVLG